MNTIRTLMAGCVAASLLVAPTTVSAGSTTESAEKLRRLDIMLMVTSLRCRMGPDDFQPDYRKFTANHLSTLNLAGRQLRADLQRRHGTKGAKRALDRISVGMANNYGQGHPWLDCGELKHITKDLAGTRDPVHLAQAADELLGPRPRSGGRFAKR